MKNLVTRECLACNNSDLKHYFQHATVTLYQCDTCRSLVAWPRPSPDEQNTLHNHPNYYKHPYFELRRSARKTIERRCSALQTSLRTAIDLQNLRGVYHLDIGCDIGSFLLAASKAWGTIPIGIDVNARSVAEACQHNIEAYCCPLETLSEHFSDLLFITAIDVIEHIVDPLAFLVEIKRRLRPGGVCYIETPNSASYIYRIGRMLSAISAGRPTRIFDRLFPSEHIQYFSRKGFSTLIEVAGLEIVYIFSRKLPPMNINTSMPVRSILTVIQMLDNFYDERILLCALIRRSPQNN